MRPRLWPDSRSSAAVTTSGKPIWSSYERLYRRAPPSLHRAAEKARARRERTLRRVGTGRLRSGEPARLAGGAGRQDVVGIWPALELGVVPNVSLVDRRLVVGGVGESTVRVT